MGSWEIVVLCFLILNFIFLVFISIVVVFYTVENWSKIKNFFAIRGTRKRSSYHEKEVLKNTLIETLLHFSSKKTGALIVFEKGSSLGLYKETGFQVDCNFSAEFVISVFTNKHASFHDGAMIVADSKIKSISSYLPVTNKMIGVKFGARHRAALGITEKTDAVAFVVSETTGFISIAKNGDLNTLKQDRKFIEETINKEINEL